MSEPEHSLTVLGKADENTGIENGGFDNNIKTEEENPNTVKPEENDSKNGNLNAESINLGTEKRKKPKRLFDNDDDDQFERVRMDILNDWQETVTRDALISEKTDIIQEDEKFDPNDLRNSNFITKSLVLTRLFLFDLIVDNKTVFIYLILLSLSIVYVIFFGFAVNYGWKDGDSYCEGIKFLFIITVLVVAGLVYYQIVKRFFGKMLNELWIKPFIKFFNKWIWKYKLVQWSFYLLLIAAVVVFLVIDSKSNRSRLISAAGLILLTLLGFIFSKYPGRIRWRHVFWGVGLQFLLALLVLRWDVGREIFQCLGDKIQLFLDYTDQGSSFVFGYLVTGNLTGWTNITVSVGPYEVFNGSDIALPMQEQLFGFKVLPVILYFSFFIQILYYYGVMQWIVKKLGWCLQVTIGTTACESINAAACIFVGQSEAPLVIQPYIAQMTKSELHAVMTGGFANIAGSTLAAYISFGIDPSHLLSASIMSAPAALGYSKLMYPETEISLTRAENIPLTKGPEKNALEAAANGASMAISLVANVAANLITFIAFIYFIDGVLSWMGSLVGWDFLTVEWILGQVFTPLAFMMGVEWEDCEEVGQLIGVKTIINEFVAFSQLGEMQANHEISERSATIATYALCGFSNISSIGIQLGCIGGLCPERKPELSQVVIRALISGCAACFMTACVAGALIDEE